MLSFVDSYVEWVDENNIYHLKLEGKHDNFSVGVRKDSLPKDVHVGMPIRIRVDGGEIVCEKIEFCHVPALDKDYQELTKIIDAMED